MDRLHTPEGLALQKTMAETSEVLLEARARYDSAMTSASDTGGTVESLLNLRRDGQSYAQALTRSTTATIDWLRYVDTVLRFKALEEPVASAKPLFDPMD